jgi:hypothetical protein
VCVCGSVFESVWLFFCGELLVNATDRTDCGGECGWDVLRAGPLARPVRLHAACLLDVGLAKLRLYTKQTDRERRYKKQIDM